MADRARRSTAQPRSYKDFNEKGHSVIPENAVQDQQSLMEDNITEELRDSTSPDNSETEVILQSIAKVSGKKAESKRSARNASKSSRSSSATTEAGAGLSPKKSLERERNRRSDISAEAEEMDQVIALHFDDKDDDLDKDTGNKRNYPRTPKNTSRCILSPIKPTAKKDNMPSTPVTARASPKKGKQKMSVASRLHQLPSPSWVQQSMSITNDFIAENNRIPEEVEMAKEQLRQSQIEADMAKQRLVAEETRRRTLQLQKQVQRDRKKADQEKARYEKEFKKLTVTNANIATIKTDKKHAKNTTNRQRGANNVDTVNIIDNDKLGSIAIEQHVSVQKKKYKELNPLRKARKVHATTKGHNNPNFEGEDNGLNAWLDSQLNEVDDQMKYEARYAKFNSDRSRNHDIDDVPMRGPPQIQKLDSDASVEQIEKIASELINDDNLSICRDTGIMKPRDSTKEKQKKTEVRSRFNRYEEGARYDVRHKKRPGHHISSTYMKRDRYVSEIPQWDTDRSSSSDEQNIEFETGAKLKKLKYNSCRRSPSRYDRMNEHRSRSRDRERVQREKDDWSRYDRDERRDYKKQSRDRSREHQRPYRGRKIEYVSSSSEYSPDRPKKSGISAKPTSNVREQLKYLHFSLGQVSGFIGQNLQFHNLTYEQFLAGELTTITLCEDSLEARGRTDLLQRIALWRVRANVSWAQVRNTYAHIIRKLENREIDWHVDFDKFERHIYDKIAPVGKSERNRKSTSNSSSPELVWFCKNYQRPEGCPKESPHTIKTATGYKQAQHICAGCWSKDRVKRMHSESSAECPYKEL